MYQVSNATAVLRGGRRLLRPGGGVNRTVVLLGITSLLTDMAAEMVVTVLPLYLVYFGQFSPLAFGFVDGLQRGAAALVGLASGFVGDRFGRHKEVAATGYGLSALVKLGLATLGTAFAAVSALVLIDRIGKGIRTAPRDAMIAMSTPKQDLGAAFGVHRALDTTGAMLGPLVAFGILAIAAEAFKSVFLVAFAIAMLGFGILVLLVEPEKAADRERDREHKPAATREPEAVAASAITAAETTAEAEAPSRPRLSPREALVLLKVPRFRALLLAGGALSLATVSDAFVFLVLQDKLDLSLTLFPLLFTGMAAVYMLLAVPVGRLADAIGRGRVLLAGYGLMVGVYAGLLAPIDSAVIVVLTLVLLGTYYAATDGVLAALGSALAPDEIRGSCLALLNTMTGVSKLVASVLFGALWTATDTETSIAVFGAVLVVAMALAALTFVRTREDPVRA